MQLLRILVLVTACITICRVVSANLRRNIHDNVIARTKRDVGDSCAVLMENFKEGRLSERFVKVLFNNRPMRIYVTSTDRAPSRAMAALLAAAIRYVAGVDDVHTGIDNRSISQLADEIEQFNSRVSFNDTVIRIYVDADMDEPKMGAPLLPRCEIGVLSCSIAGPRLSVIRIRAVSRLPRFYEWGKFLKVVMGRTPSVDLHVYAVLSKNSSNNSECFGVNSWAFYRNSTNTQKCDFTYNVSDVCIPIYITEDFEDSKDIGNFESELRSFIDNAPICDNFTISRTELNALLNKVDLSFIFVDYELGYEKINRSVRIVQLPHQPLIHEPVVSMRVADNLILRTFDPDIVEILRYMRPEPEDLRQVLNNNATMNNIDEAACSWANDNQVKFRTWTTNLTRLIKFHIILCDNPDLIKYLKLTNALNDNLKDILKDDIKFLGYDFSIGVFKNNCTYDSLSDFIQKYNKRSDWQKVAGVAVPRSFISSSLDLQTVFYDILPPPIVVPSSLKKGISTSGGSLQQLTKSLRYFFKEQGWNRIAIISEKSTIAENITSELSRELNSKAETLNSLDTKTIAKALLNFQNANARVFFINADPTIANLVICEAKKLGMITVDDEYAWIAREWQPTMECHHGIKVFTVSYWWRGGNETLMKDYGGNEKIRTLIKETFEDNTPWPLLTEPIVDAVLLMIYRVQMVLHKYPERFYDLHTREVITLMEDQSNGNDKLSGVMHKIHQIENKQHNPFVYVTAWQGNVSDLVAIWKVNDTDDIEVINTIYEPYYGGKKPHDGETKCVTTTSGDKFNPFCHDAIWFSAVAILMVIPLVVWKTRQLILLKFKKQERETLMRLLSRCEETAAVLKPYLVDRSALELYEELGSGHFGRVRFGMLRARNRIPTPIAAKTLRENSAPAEEAEFLREASKLATLSHDHIVRLVGICADADGPPLLLMDHAFFGDLLKYLRQRRHLVEVNERNSRISDVSVEDKALKESLDPEARHVSPEELTRLAREAAEALDYLGANHLLHRDIRAANCLIDARRVLKLADFGMARCIEAKTKSPLENTGESEDYKYICCRRGVFPVPWMAPESLERGEFSRASDVWALGVLMLEIATLGARPYGSWNPMQVLRFVRSGGRPPLPRDASYHTCVVTEKCWTDKPAERATAKEVVDYLIAQPKALRGALRPAWPEPTEGPDGSDSGFGDKTEQDWPKSDDLRVSTF